MKKILAFLKNSFIISFLFILNTKGLFAMSRLYFEKEDSLMLKVLVLIGGMMLGILITAKIIYPELVAKGMNPFKAKNIFNVTVYSFFVLLYGITFHTMINILYLSIALGIIMLAWMLIAIIKN